MKLDVIIPTKCSGAKIFNLIDSIYRCTNPKTLDDTQFIILYTGTEDEEMKQVDEKLKSLNHKIIKMPYNFAKCSNAGAKAGDGEAILFLNDDIELKEDSITHCLQILESDKDRKFGTVGIQLLYDDGSIQHCGHLLVHEDGKFVGVTHYLLHAQCAQNAFDFVSVGNTGAFLMIRRDDFEEAGMFDEEFEHCFEDCKLNWQMLIKGKLNVTCASTIATHFESQTRHQELSKHDVDRMKDFFNENSEKILEKSEILKRTIKDRAKGTTI